MSHSYKYWKKHTTRPFNLTVLLIGVVAMPILPSYKFLPFFLAILAIIGYQAKLQNELKNNGINFSFFVRFKKYKLPILAFAAYVVNTDQKSIAEESDFIKEQLEKDYKPKYVKKYLRIFKVFLAEDIDIKRISTTINERYSYKDKIQLLYFLVGLICVDGVLTNQEEHKISAIAKYLRVPYKSLNVLLAMFKNVYKEHANNTNGNLNTPKKGVDFAYRILEIPTDTTAMQIKKSYRRLVKIHHPDKVVHLGIEFQLKAKLKFQEIQKAYELIKLNRGIK